MDLCLSMFLCIVIVLGHLSLYDNLCLSMVFSITMFVFAVSAERYDPEADDDEGDTKVRARFVFLSV